MPQLVVNSYPMMHELFYLSHTEFYLFWLDHFLLLVWFMSINDNTSSDPLKSLFFMQNLSNSCLISPFLSCSFFNCALVNSNSVFTKASSLLNCPSNLSAAYSCSFHSLSAVRGTSFLVISSNIAIRISCCLTLIIMLSLFEYILAI